MVRICMAGACGRMGRRILELAGGMDGIEIGGVFDAPENADMVINIGATEVTVAGSPAEALAASDVLIDFTTAAVSIANARAAAAAGLPSVIGTTGLDDAGLSDLAELAKKAAVVYAPNMSAGVNLLFQLTVQTARKLGLDYNIEIVEMHHNQKQDSPSGTALRLAACAAEGLDLDLTESGIYGRHGQTGRRPVREIGVHAVRGGDVVGEHTVIFAGAGERIELTHKAHSRDNFAQGALVAARFAAGADPGLYDMQDVLGLR
jgi:4-hydroxy-tetrahydrodipicolinate reductase